MATQEITRAIPISVDIEKVLLTGDLSKLTPDQRLSYYRQVCDSLGLNPLTNPFQYLQLNGKTVLYAAKSCTEQLRKLNGVSVTSIDGHMVQDVYVVTTKVSDRQGRTDAATGAVALGQLKGEALANALMKAETKSKRRATLSICGLGMLDETEVDSIPEAKRLTPEQATAYVREQLANLPSAPPIPPAEVVPEGYIAYEESPDGDQARFTLVSCEAKDGKNGEYRKLTWREGAASCFVPELFDSFDKLKPSDVVTVGIKRNPKNKYINITSLIETERQQSSDEDSLFIGEAEASYETR